MPHALQANDPAGPDQELSGARSSSAYVTGISGERWPVIVKVLSGPLPSILVSGASAFIGVHIARRLVAAEHHVTMVYHRHPTQLAGKTTRAVQLDLSDDASIDDAFGAARFRAVVHTARV